MTRRPVPLAVVEKPRPVRIVVTAERAEANYPGSMFLQQRWREACLWMQSHVGGSIWIMDAEARRPKWSVPE